MFPEDKLSISLDRTSLFLDFLFVFCYNICNSSYSRCKMGACEKFEEEKLILGVIYHENKKVNTYCENI